MSVPAEGAERLSEILREIFALSRALFRFLNAE